MQQHISNLELSPVKAREKGIANNKQVDQGNTFYRLRTQPLLYMSIIAS